MQLWRESVVTQRVLSAMLLLFGAFCALRANLVDGMWNYVFIQACATAVVPPLAMFLFATVANNRLGSKWYGWVITITFLLDSAGLAGMAFLCNNRDPPQSMCNAWAVGVPPPLQVRHAVAPTPLQQCVRGGCASSC